MANIRLLNGGIRAMWQKYGWKLVSIGFPLVFAFAGWATYVEISLASDGKRLDKIDSAMVTMSQIQSDIKVILENSTAKLDIILQLLGIKIQDSTIARWKNMPRSLPLDSLGKPIRNSPWLDVTDGYLLGTIYKWVSADSILTKVAWDERPEKQANDER